MPSPFQIADNEGFDAQAVLSGLARAKVAFQLRAINTVITGEAFRGRTATAAGSQAPRPAADNFSAAIGTPDAAFSDSAVQHAHGVVQP